MPTRPASRLPTVAELENIVDDDDEREHLGNRGTRPVTYGQRVRFYAEVTVPSILEGDEQYRNLGYLTVTATDGRTALIPFDYEGAMKSSDSTYERFEPARDRPGHVRLLFDPTVSQVADSG